MKDTKRRDLSPTVSFAVPLLRRSLRVIGSLRWGTKSRHIMSRAAWLIRHLWGLVRTFGLYTDVTNRRKTRPRGKKGFDTHPIGQERNCRCTIAKEAFSLTTSSIFYPSIRGLCSRQESRISIEQCSQPCTALTVQYRHGAIFSYFSQCSIEFDYIVPVQFLIIDITM